MLMSASAAPTRTTEPTAKAAADPFSELLSTVIADSSLTATPILVTTPPPPVKTSLPTQPSKSVDSSVVVQPQPPVTVAAPKAELRFPLFRKITLHVRRAHESSWNRSMGLVFSSFFLMRHLPESRIPYLCSYPRISRLKSHPNPSLWERFLRRLTHLKQYPDRCLIVPIVNP